MSAPNLDEILGQAAAAAIAGQPQPTLEELTAHDFDHVVTRGWGRPTRKPWCGPCEVGEGLWAQYGPGASSQ